jgi:hypothetical protein
MGSTVLIRTRFWTYGKDCFGGAPRERTSSAGCGSCASLRRERRFLRRAGVDGWDGAGTRLAEPRQRRAIRLRRTRHRGYNERGERPTVVDRRYRGNDQRPRLTPWLQKTRQRHGKRRAGGRGRLGGSPRGKSVGWRIVWRREAIKF